MRKNTKKIINILALVIITCLVLYFSLKDNFAITIDNIIHANIIWLIIAFLFLVFFWIFKTYALYLIVKVEHSKFKFRQALQLILRTQFFNAVTPFATGGQPFQVLYLNKCGISYPSATGLVVENFIVYQIVLVFLGLVAVISNYFLHIFKEVNLLKQLVTLGFIVNAGVIIVMFIVAFGKKINKKLVNFGIRVLTKLKLVKDKEEKLEQWDKTINQFHKSATNLLKNRRVFIKSLLVELLSLVCLYTIPLIIFYSMGLYNSVTLFECVVASAYVMLMGSFVPIPGGTGGLEYGFVAFYGTFIKGGTLSAIMLIWRFITYYFGLIIGSISVNMRRVE